MHLFRFRPDDIAARVISLISLIFVSATPPLIAASAAWGFKEEIRQFYINSLMFRRSRSASRPRSHRQLRRRG